MISFVLLHHKELELNRFKADLLQLEKMDATNLHVATLGVTALMTVISFLMFVHYALRRNLLWAIICLSCFFILIQPRILIGKTTVVSLVFINKKYA